MLKNDLGDALKLLNCGWITCDGRNYDSVVWRDPDNKPTKEQVQEKMEIINKQRKIEDLRMNRNNLLNNTDKYVSTDRPMEQTLKQLWLDYRQSLRDLPQNYTPEYDNNGELINIPWPTKPS